MKSRKTKALVVLGFVSVLFFLSCLTKVRLDEVGIKVNNLGGGIVSEDYKPGTYFVLPGAQKMWTLDPTVQTYKMGGVDATIPSLQLVGKDQYTTRFDVSVLYRIKSGKAHEVARDVGMMQERIRNFVRSKADKVLWDSLGRLNTQDFYDVERREAARIAARTELGTELSPRNLEVIDILIRAIEYDRNLEHILVQKQLLDQNKALNVEKTLLEKELEKTQSIERETEAKVSVIAEEMVQEIANIVAKTDADVRQLEADADLKSQKLLAEADRYRRTKQSDGELAKTQAQAKGDKAINQAYLGGGGQAFITKKMIEGITFGEIEVNTNKVNPFDVDQLLEMLGLRSTASAEK